MSLLGGLIGAGVSLVGGLFGRKDKKKQDRQAQQNTVAHNNALLQASKIPLVTTDEHEFKSTITDTRDTASNTATGISSWVDFGRLVKDAEAAGFNPLTALRNGAVGGYFNSLTNTAQVSRDTASQTNDTRYKTTQTVTGHNAMAGAGSPMPVSTAPSLGTVFAGAAQDGFNIYREGQAQAQADNLQRELMKAQIEGINRANSARSRSFYVPTNIRQSGGAARTGGADLSRNAGSKGSPLPPTFEIPTVTNPHTTYNVDPTKTDAAMKEERYGEVLSELGGVSNLANDLWYNVTGMTAQQRFDVTTAAIDQTLKAGRDIINRAEQKAAGGLKPALFSW